VDYVKRKVTRRGNKRERKKKYKERLVQMCGAFENGMVYEVRF